MCPFPLSEAPHTEYEIFESPLEGYKKQRLFWKNVYERLAKQKRMRKRTASWISEWSLWVRSS
jgi:hypothetical protein